MEQPKIKDYLIYSDVASSAGSANRMHVDVPIGYAVSLLLPTRRFGFPAYAAFASPSLRDPGKPVTQGPPDRWWLLDARRGSLALFAMCRIYHFADTHFETVVLPSPTGTLANLREELADIRTQMDGIVLTFFQGEAGDQATQRKLLAALKSRIPELIWPQYEAIAPDFFLWLKK